MNNIIETQGISKRYNGNPEPSVKDVSFAVREGEIRADEAADDKYRIGAKETSPDLTEKYADQLPATLRELMRRAERLYERVTGIDAKVYCAPQGALAEPEVSRQLSALQQAFGDV